MARKIMDCREMPSEKGCTLTIAGEEDEVFRAAVMHAVDAHGHQDTPELREEVRRSLKLELEPGGEAQRAQRGGEAQPASH